MPGSLTDLLEYLDGIGYGDLYLSKPTQEKGLAVGVADAVAARRAVVARDAEPSSPPDRPPARPRAAVPPPGSSAAPSRTAEPSRREVQAKAHVEPTSTIPVIKALVGGELPQDLGSRMQALASVARQASTCEACGLCRQRRNVVFGSGDPQADLMFIGEGPGADEDRQGLPFVGPSGALLSKIIQAIDLTRDDVYIANVVKCRPPSNRDPLPDEVASCRPYLEAQIDLVQPKVIVALGRVAAQMLFQSTESLGKMRGRWHQVRGVAARATYHPAALLRNGSWKRPTWEDMQIVRDRLRGGESQ